MNIFLNKFAPVNNPLNYSGWKLVRKLASVQNFNMSASFEKLAFLAFTVSEIWRGQNLIPYTVRTDGHRTDTHRRVKQYMSPEGGDI